MRLVLQRVSSAAVRAEPDADAPHAPARESSIGRGLLILVGVQTGDAPADADWCADKTAHLRIFPDDAGKMNRSIQDIGGAALVVSQFTLLADAARGNRPSFVRAARPELAAPLVERFAARLRDDHGVPTRAGFFGAHMEVTLVNDGPVTIVLDSPPPAPA